VDRCGKRSGGTIRGKMNPHMNAAMPERRPSTEEISGIIERVTFHNDDSVFCVPSGSRMRTNVVTLVTFR
jgi:hypothetical protein